jgi:hypothetical protein
MITPAAVLMTPDDPRPGHSCGRPHGRTRTRHAARERVICISIAAPMSCGEPISSCHRLARAASTPGNSSNQVSAWLPKRAARPHRDGAGLRFETQRAVETWAIAPGRAVGLADLVMSAFEGALVLSRAARSTETFKTTVQAVADAIDHEPRQPAEHS